MWHPTGFGKVADGSVLSRLRSRPSNCRSSNSQIEMCLCQSVCHVTGTVCLSFSLSYSWIHFLSSVFLSLFVYALDYASIYICVRQHVNERALEERLENNIAGRQNSKDGGGGGQDKQANSVKSAATSWLIFFRRTNTTASTFSRCLHPGHLLFSFSPTSCAVSVLSW